MARPRYDVSVPPNGYRWWYVDALSDDGQNGLTIIGFIGSVFSPYYKRARRKGMVDPENHCAINVALYGSKRRWAMTERGAKNLSRDAKCFTLGPSAMSWEGDMLVINIDERCMPFPFALRGTVRLKVNFFYDEPVMLDQKAKHFWQAIAPDARVTVEFENPKLSWAGSAYHDMNWGDEPLENAFKNWTWARATTPNGTQVIYDVNRRDGSNFQFGRRFQNGTVETRDVPMNFILRNGLWGMSRNVKSEKPPQLLRTLEDTPFYTRNHVALTLDGHSFDAVHESLSLDRFVHPVMQLMLPFRMPRRR